MSCGCFHLIFFSERLPSSFMKPHPQTAIDALSRTRSRPHAALPSFKACSRRHGSDYPASHGESQGEGQTVEPLSERRSIRDTPFSEWFRVWRRITRNYFARLVFIHTQIPFCHRSEPSKVLRADVHRACLCMKAYDFEGALDALSPPPAPHTRQ